MLIKSGERMPTPARKARRMIRKILSLNNFWKFGAIVSLAAIPVFLLSRKKMIEKGVVPEAGDEWDIFSRELRAD